MAEVDEPGYQRMPVSCLVDDQKTSGFVLRRDLQTAERIRRSAKVIAIFFGTALLTVFIPILHFILPPLFLLLAIVFGITTWLESAEVLRGEITCPNCQKQMQLRHEAEQWPKSLRCEGCSYMLKIVRQ